MFSQWFLLLIIANLGFGPFKEIITSRESHFINLRLFKHLKYYGYIAHIDNLDSELKI